jgi:serine phosphatase RsbU (regulator of sigma subunit)/anti-sigma regulatory factor (Ser/Thr protein kinase)
VDGSDDAHRLALLSRSGSLLGTSLDVPATIAALGQLLVPTLADHCVIDLVDDAGRPVRLAVVHAEGTGGEAASWEPVGRRVDYPAVHPSAEALRTGRVVHVPEVLSQDVESAAPTPESAAYARRVGLREALCLPLRARGVTRGVLSLATSVSGRSYSAADIELLREVTARAALALDNALLFTEQRALALTLQRSLLPAALPDLDGIEVASRYLPGRDAEVGGDWYDVIPLSAGRVGVVIGDVQGRGAPAAALMGQLRAVVRAYAHLDVEPQRLLGHVDELVRGLGLDVLVTCTYLAYDPWTRRAVVASAGHPPPLMAEGSGCAALPIPAGPPLGVGGVPFVQRGVQVPPGGRLALYTDGLVDRRGGDFEVALRVLCAAVGAAGATPEQACDAALSALGDPPDDDRALLVLRTATEDLPYSQVPLAAELTSVSGARSHAVDVVKAWGFGEHADLVELLVSELVTNALRYASPTSPVSGASEEDPTSVRLRMRRGRFALWAEVFDPDLRLPRLRLAGDRDEGGRGLYLVDALASRWGTRPTRSGKIVWFEVSLH